MHWHWYLMPFAYWTRRKALGWRTFSMIDYLSFEIRSVSHWIRMSLSRITGYQNIVTDIGFGTFLLYLSPRLSVYHALLFCSTFSTWKYKNLNCVRSNRECKINNIKAIVSVVRKNEDNDKDMTIIDRDNGWM